MSMWHIHVNTIHNISTVNETYFYKHENHLEVLHIPASAAQRLSIPKQDDYFHPHKYKKGLLQRV
jgi:hypothetical protein